MIVRFWIKDTEKALYPAEPESTAKSSGSEMLPRLGETVNLPARDAARVRDVYWSWPDGGPEVDFYLVKLPPNGGGRVRKEPATACTPPAEAGEPGAG